MTIKDGGPAFPQTTPASPYAEPFLSGMWLRDYFAGQALAGFLAALKTAPRQQNEVATFMEAAALASYQIADEMLKERAK